MACNYSVMSHRIQSTYTTNLGEWAIASHGKGTCPREVACVDYHYLLDILHSETTNRNCDNISIWTKGNLHFICRPLNFKKLAEIMIMVRDLCQKTSFNVTGPMAKWF